MLRRLVFVFPISALTFVGTSPTRPAAPKTPSSRGVQIPSLAHGDRTSRTAGRAVADGSPAQQRRNAQPLHLHGVTQCV